MTREEVEAMIMFCEREAAEATWTAKDYHRNFVANRPLATPFYDRAAMFSRIAEVLKREVPDA
jgi:hypothetical protein